VGRGSYAGCLGNIYLSKSLVVSENCIHYIIRIDLYVYSVVSQRMVRWY
jgi:hypothetical protein